MWMWHWLDPLGSWQLDKWVATLNQVSKRKWSDDGFKEEKQFSASVAPDYFSKNADSPECHISRHILIVTSPSSGYMQATTLARTQVTHICFAVVIINMNFK